MLDFVLGLVLGIGGPSVYRELADSRRSDRTLLTDKKIWKRSLLAHLLEDRERYRRVLNAAFHVLAADESVREQRLRAFVGEVLSSFGGPQQLLAMNNSLHAHSFQLLSLIPRSVGVAVFRDPRDQFVSRSYEKPGMSVERFVKSLKRNFRKYEAAIGTLEQKPIEVQFEKFVTSVDCRRDLIRRLGLNEHDRTREQRLFPELSAGNIGIHRAYPNQDDIRAIERAFPERLLDVG